MQIHATRGAVQDGELAVRLNPGTKAPFAIVEIGFADIFLASPEDCDRLIKAAVAAKRLLSPPPVTPDPDACRCGHAGYAHIFRGTSPCTQCECEGFYAAAAAIVAKAVEDGTPVIVEDEDEDEDGRCPSVSPWNYRCAVGKAAHAADPRIAHSDRNGDTWFDRGVGEPGGQHMPQVLEHLARQESRS